MKLRVKELKRIINEVALSPSVFNNNQPVDDPMDKPTVAKAVAALQEPFKRTVEANLILNARASYDEQSREFDDDVYQHIQQAATKAGETMLARVHKAVQQSWQEAMAATAGEEKQPTKQPAQKRVA